MTDPAAGVDLTLSRAAHEIVAMEDSSVFCGSGQIALGTGFPDARTFEWFGRQGRTATVRSFRLTDAVLDPSRMLLQQNGGLLTDTSYLLPATENKAITMPDDRLIRLDATEDLIIGANKGHWNYYHWITQALPSIDLAIRHRRRDAIRLVLPKLTAWQEYTLKLLGHARLPRLEPDVHFHYAIPHAEYPQFLNGSLSYAISLAALVTFRRLADAVPPARSSWPAIYVARTDAANRPARNEAALIDYLRQLGVLIVVPGELSIAAQISLFRSASLVIGLHGAGLTNIVFSRPGTVVYELLPAHYANACFNRMAQAAELDYWCDLFPGEAGEDPHTRGWQIDLGIVRARLAAIRHAMPSDPLRG